MATKANHHYIPQFYLRGFADGVGRQARVFTFDSNSKRSFTTLVRNVGSRRHFNRIDVHGIDSNNLEDSIAHAEAHWAQRLKDVVQARSFPTQDHFLSTMDLIATLSVRNPRLRRVLEGFHKDILERTMEIALSSEEIWNSQTKKMRAEGYSVNDGAAYEEIRQFHENNEFDIEINQTYLIEKELRMVEHVFPHLVRRNWCVVSAAEGSQFITSDDPVALCWSDEKYEGLYSPGYGLNNTVIFFSLCPDLLLIGMFEELQKEAVHTPAQMVAANTNIAGYSTRQIYAKDGKFFIHLKHRENVRGDELADHFAQ